MHVLGSLWNVEPSASSWVGKAYAKDGCVWLPFWAWITNSFILANRSLSCWGEHSLFRGARHLMNSSIFGWTWSRNFHIFESLKPRACTPGKMRRCGNSWDRLTWLHFGWSVTSGVSVIKIIYVYVDGSMWIQFNENERSTWMIDMTIYWSACACFVMWELFVRELVTTSRVCAVKVDTWLILPVVICLSQRLSHACLSINLYTVKLRMAH
jgi:hypothetical protein